MICFLRSFLSTPSARRATPERRIQRLQQPISIHALREEGDPHRHHLSKLAQKFLSTPSARRATCCRPPARGLSPISIHALREEGDILQTRKILARDDFYPRPPRGGRRRSGVFSDYNSLFLSTPSARRATPTATTSLNSRKNFYPRPPRGGRPVVVLQHVGFHQFLSTPSARRATFYRPGRYLPGMISIHALREEGDSVLSLNFDFFDISIHALREEGDPSSAVRFWLQKVFLSTPSARRATSSQYSSAPTLRISIHALREEGDRRGESR